MRLLLCLLMLLTWHGAAALEFSLHKQSSGAPGNTLLVVGGIQGDEPGGFNAASLLVTHYRILSGNLWVVPNLNFESIVRRSRGVHGDMNRKFPSVPPDDPDHHRVEKIKRIITSPDVDFVFNLHDGSGFYRHEHEDALRSPRRWGQSIIIDQEQAPLGPFGDLGPRARSVAGRVNGVLVDDGHRYHVKNTETGKGNREMARTLTWFALNNAKPAVGVEASKELPTHLRAYYHLQVLEAYMRELGVAFERGFELTPESVRRVIDDNVRVSLYGDRVFLDMADVRRRLNYVPVPRSGEVDYRASSPLVAIVRRGGQYAVSYGNRDVTELAPEFLEFDDGRDSLAMLVDGRALDVPLGTVVEVGEHFEVAPVPGYRVNVIGWRGPARDEAGFHVRHEDIESRFSVDRSATTFRVELYRGDRFTGMVLVRFPRERRGASLDPDGVDCPHCPAGAREAVEETRT